MYTSTVYQRKHNTFQESYTTAVVHDPVPVGISVLVMSQYYTYVQK